MDIVSTFGQLASQSPPLVAALILGLMTSLSPCPLGSNLAAIAMLARGAPAKREEIMRVLAYGAGRVTTYLLLGIAVGLIGEQALQIFSPLQAHSELLLAIVLGISGLALLGKITLEFSFDSSGLGKFVKEGAVGAFLLGLALAFVFCPVSAALFLGGVVPLLFSTHDLIGIPLAYGLGTSLGVGAMAIAFDLAARSGGKRFHIPPAWTKAIEAGMGILFLAASAFYLLAYAGVL
jgi:cytochrome c biogenesis protein CcdA